MRGLKTEKSKAKFRKTKHANMLAKYDWDFIEPYLDVEINLSSRNRKSKYFTLKEFKRLTLDGNSLSKIIKDLGYSKHIVYFMSSFAQKKNNITKEQFEDAYSSGASLDEISQRFGIPRENITFLRQLYGMKSKGPTFIRRKETEVPLSGRQKELIIGSLLGDATYMGTSAVKFKHGHRQRDYLIWKLRELKNLVSENALRVMPYEDNRGYKGIFYRFYTKANTDIENIIRMFYGDGHKVVSNEILDKLTPFSIAVWYMDDGITDFHHRSGHNATASYGICTDSFTHDECDLICRHLKDRYGIVSYVRDTERGHPRVRIRSVSSSDFSDIIKPYLIPCMRYKAFQKDPRVFYDRNKLAKNPPPLMVDMSSKTVQEQQCIVNKIVDYYSIVGFDYITPKSWEFKKDLSSLMRLEVPSSVVKKKGPIRFQNNGWKFCLANFSNFWDARSKGNISPRSVFENRRYLSEIIRKILLDGKDSSPSNLLRQLRRYRGNKAVSAFMPAMAKMIYERYSPKKAKVLDFCGGYGGRMLGASSSTKVSEYLALEPNFDTYLGLLQLKGALKAFSDTKCKIDVLNRPSPVGMESFDDNRFDFCFTSVPYFDAEEYSDDDTQSWVRYSDSYDVWFEKFLLASIREALRVSKMVAINVSNTGGYMISDDLRKVLPDICTLLVEDKLEYPNYGRQKYEELFVLGKK